MPLKPSESRSQSVASLRSTEAGNASGDEILREIQDEKTIRHVRGCLRGLNPWLLAHLPSEQRQRINQLQSLVGIGNVRGRIMPVVDLARRLRLRSVERGRSARVLIVQHNDEPYGLVVDAVIDVTRIPPDKIEDKPGGITGARAEYIRGLGRRKSTGPRAGAGVVEARASEAAEDIVIILNLVTLLDPRDFVRFGPGEEGRG